MFSSQFAKESPERTEKVDKKPGFWDWLWSGGAADEEGKETLQQFSSICPFVNGECFSLAEMILNSFAYVMG